MRIRTRGRLWNWYQLHVQLPIWAWWKDRHWRKAHRIAKAIKRHDPNMVGKSVYVSLSPKHTFRFYLYP